MAAPADEEMSDPENRDEDDIRDVPDADLEEESNDTESEKEQERPVKKQREEESDRDGKRQRTAMLSSRARRHPPGPNAGDIIDTSAGRGEAELQSLFRTSTVRKILDELNEKPKFQMKHRTKDRKNLG